MEWLVISVIVTTFGGLISYANWRSKKYQAWRQQIQTSDTLFVAGDWEIFQYTVDVPANLKSKWDNGLLVVTHKRIAIYKYPQPEPLFTIQAHELRGFWRPEKYSSAINEIWIHAQIGLTWHILKVRLYQSTMQALVRALKAISTDEQTKAYRRRRPYIHRGVTPAYPATQNLQGAWELDAPINLYVMPLHLVLFQQNEVQNVLDLADIQQIAALRRIEGGKPDGLIRFTSADETFAFALDDYEAWASDLAEAAKRTLEEPMMQKRKGKDEDDDFDE